MQDMMQTLTQAMPELRGRLRQNAELAHVNWLRVGGPAEILFKPEDADDLAYFLAHKPQGLGVTVLGVGSNLLVRDGGIEGAVIRLGRGFADCRAEGDRIVAGAGCLNASLVQVAQAHGLGGLEFLSGIPGSAGGALFMNAGAYGVETKDILVEAEAIDPRGRMHRLTPAHIGYGYRHCSLERGWIFTRATFQGKAQDAQAIAQRLAAIAADREAAQPVRARTGGSTFKNPPAHKAWRLIEEAGCRGLAIGGAQMSEKHCNFMINTGGASASDLEMLGEEVIMRVFAQTGIRLEWEIQRVGKALESEAEKAVA